MTDSELLASLLDEERRLVFRYFDHQVAWQLGSAMREAALEADYPVAILIRRSGQRMFETALPGSSADNDAWLDRKSAVVDRFGHSSCYVGCLARSASDVDCNVAARLAPEHFAAHGGAFPLLLEKSGLIGTVCVSGLPQADDHRFVVEQIELFRATSTGR